MLVKLNGELIAKRCAPALFRLAKKFGEIGPWSCHYMPCKTMKLQN
jgi:hypothetical protein